MDPLSARFSPSRNAYPNMADLPPRNTNRPRVAVPLASPPVLTPSLIPFDVLQAYEREVAQVARANEEAELILSEEVLSVEQLVTGELDAEASSEVGIVTERPADRELAL